MKTIISLACLLVILGFSSISDSTRKIIFDTGQQLCYDDTVQISPPSYSQHYFGQDAQFIGTPISFTDNGDGTISDLKTGLMWQKTDAGPLSYLNSKYYCEDLALAGYTDWRMPSSDDIFNILNFSKSYAAFDTSYFEKSTAEYWWTSDVSSDSEAKIYAIKSTGRKELRSKSESINVGGYIRFHVRAVRTISNTNLPAVRFVDNGDGTITDNHTGLMWQKVRHQSYFIWRDALKKCKEMTLAGYLDWRMPNIKELQSLTDLSKSLPAIDTTVFPGIRYMYLWSSTTYTDNISSVLAWHSNYGEIVSMGKRGAVGLLCVRGTSTVTGTNSIETSIPDKYYLAQNYPNPFNPSTTINFQIPKNSFVSLKVFDINGREASELVNENLQAGEYKINFDGSNLPSGVYYYKLTSENFSETKKMILVK